MTAIPAINRPMTSYEWGMLLALSALWGGSFFFTDVALRALPPFTLVLLRVAGAALILNAVIPVLGLRLPTDARSWIAFFGMGFLNNAVPFCLIAWGQTHIVSGLAAILNATTPLWTVIVTHFLTTEEKMTANRLAGVVIGLIGVTIMIGPTVFEGLGATILAQISVLGAAISYAFAALFGRRFRRMGVVPMVTATGQVTASTLLLLPVALFVDHPWSLAMPGLPVWAAVFGIAALSTALAYVLYFRILATAGTTNLMLVTFLIPVSAILLGALVLGEQLDTKQFIGMMLIGMALAAIDGRLMKRFKP
jgi:drug/metabolite transporter (DMT)-like permease